jgi:hypothetical protein
MSLRHQGVSWIKKPPNAILILQQSSSLYRSIIQEKELDTYNFQHSRMLIYVADLEKVERKRRWGIPNARIECCIQNGGNIEGNFLILWLKECRERVCCKSSWRVALYEKEIYVMHYVVEASERVQLAPVTPTESLCACDQPEFRYSRR